MKFGVGLNTGECCVGNLGSTRRFDYSAIGDEVNIASRLEGASKVLGVDIVASGLTRDDAPDFAWLEVDRFCSRARPARRPSTLWRATRRPPRASLSANWRGGMKRSWPPIAPAISQSPRRLADEAAALAPREIQGLYTSYYQERFAFLATSELGPAWAPVFRLETK